MLTPISTGEHRDRTGDAHHRQQHQHRGQVVDHVGQQRRDPRRWPAGQAARCRRDQPVHRVAQAVGDHRMNHHTQAQHEEPETGHPAAAAIPRDRAVPAGQHRAPRVPTAPARAAQAGDRSKQGRHARIRPAWPPAPPARRPGMSAGGEGRVHQAVPVAARVGRTAAAPRTRRPSTASQGSAITAAKWTKDSPAAPKASRLVRLDTGSSSEALLDRCAVA